MPARLTLQPEQAPPHRWLLFEDESYVVGRDPDCDLVADDERVSRRHLRFECREGVWRVVDLGSKNGLALDGLVVRDAELGEAAWLSVGGVPGLFERIDSGDARRELERRSRRWAVSAEYQRRLDPQLELDDLLQRVLASVLELTSAERGFVLLDRARGLEVAAASSFGEGALEAPEFKGSVGAVERVLRERRPVASGDLGGSTSLGNRPSVQAAGIRALVCAPLVAMGETLGALYADSRSPGACFDALDVELLEAFAGHAALALALARIQEEVAQVADHLHSRRASAGTAPESEGAVAAAAGRSNTLWEELVRQHGAESG